MRLRGPALMLVGVLALASQLVADDRPCHVFLLAGQSNIVRLNPDSDFMPEAQKLLPDAQVLYVKVAYGGQPIRRWVPQWDQIAQRHGIDVESARAKDKSREAGYYQELLAKTKKVLADHKVDSVSLCWMQGSADVKAGLAAAYEESLTQLIANLRRDLDRPGLNVVIARMSDFKPSDQRGEVVRQAQRSVVSHDPRGAWVDTDDCNDYEENGRIINDLHLTPQGYRVLGGRLARQAVALIQGRPPAADGRPGADLVCTPTPRSPATQPQP